MGMNKKVVKRLAAHWVKDERTIKTWLKKKNHPMITHPDSQKIIQDNK